MNHDSSPLLFGSPRVDGQTISTAEQPARWQSLVDLHGPAGAAARVQGDFAVAMTLADGSTFMAVDRFAVHSLCYRVDGSTLRFAARADQLGASEIDAQGLFDYLYFHIVPSPRTVFDGVQRLPPGHCAHFKDGQLQVTPYWVPRFEPARQASFGALKEEFGQLLRQAVRRQLGSGPAACFLSGGTDSSTVAGVLAEVADGPVTCYSIGFEAEGYDEMAFARTAARHFGCRHQELYVTPDDLVRDIPKVAAFYDQPFGNSSALPSYHCALHARADGVERMLAGDGGDELFGGNSRYATQKVFDWYQMVPLALRTHLLEPLLRQGFVASVPVLKRGPGYVRLANTPLPDRGQAFNLLRRLGFDQVLSDAMLAQVDAASVALQQRAVWAEAEAADELNRHLAYDWRYTLAECDLPKVCGTTRLAGIDVAFPMLDDDLLAFSMRLPAEYKLKGMKLRWFFKEALRGFLPDEIITKKKQGFGLPFGVWMVRHAGLQALAKDALASLDQRGIFRAGFTQQLLQQRLPEHPHYYGTMVWLLLMLEHWLRHHQPGFRLQA
ncbi:MAG TPA: asparagine synthase C-terminal domain-containing protein [Aquabacterium sp.]|nr:asparagine synthase C-terminal domain-containing protein [Aquabacterium sp.]